MSEQERKEFNTFLSFFAAFNLAWPVTTVADLSDGAALFDVLALVYVPFICP
jgi:protein HOOK3